MKKILSYILILISVSAKAQVVHKGDTLSVNIRHIPDSTLYKAFIEINRYKNDSNQFIWFILDTRLNDTTIFYGNPNIDSLLINGINHYININKDTVIFDSK